MKHVEADQQGNAEAALPNGDLLGGANGLRPPKIEHLRQARAHEIRVGVQDHHALADLLLALEHLFRSELVGLGAIGAGNRLVRQAVRTVGVPG